MAEQIRSDCAKTTFSELIGAILDAVDDEGFPASLNHHVETVVDEILSDGRNNVVAWYMKNPESIQAEKRFYEVHREIDKMFPTINGIESLITEMGEAYKAFLIAIGFAAGLRGAGASRQQAEIMLRGYLRHFNKDQ